MTQFGYTAMGEQTPARQLITDLVAAEAAGFDFSVMSDHYFPWLEEQGHSPNAWAVLGAAAQATERLPLTLRGAERVQRRITVSRPDGSRYAINQRAAGQLENYSLSDLARPGAVVTVVTAGA